MDDLERGAPGRIGQTYAIKYNPEHRWCWFPRMRRKEAYAFKVFDSMKDGRARWTAHIAFEGSHHSAACAATRKRRRNDAKGQLATWTPVQA
jgi:hypothetical protein